MDQNIVLKAEIELKERELAKILTEIENLQKNKGAALRQFDEQIKGRSKQIEQLTAEGKRIQGLVHLYSQSYQDIEKEIEKIKEERDKAVLEAETAVKNIHSEAEQRDSRSKSREENVGVREVAVTKREKAVDDRAIEVDRRAIENENKEKELSQKEGQLSKDEETAKKAVAEAQQLLDDIERQIKEKRMQIPLLDNAITQKTTQAEKIGIEAQRKYDTAVRLAALLDRKEADLNEKDQRLIKREIKVADREATVGRAYRETIRRGGKVN